MNDSNSKKELIDSIARKMKFIGSHRYFVREELEKKTVDELKTKDDMFSHVVRVHSNPLYKKISLAIYHGRMDPRWRPFIKRLKWIAKSGTFRERQIKKALIKHLTKSSLLLNYINTLQLLALEKYTEKSEEPFPWVVDICNANNKIKSIFQKYDSLYLLERPGLSFTHREKFFIKVLVQELRSDDKFEFEKDFLKPDIENQKKEDRDPAPAPPKKANELFGSISKYNNINLLEYGTLFLNNLFIGNRFFTLKNE